VIGEAYLTDPYPSAIALRAYVRPQEYEARKGDVKTKQSRGPDIVVVLDSETRTDSYQSPIFGSCGAWFAGRLQWLIILHSLDLKPAEREVIRNYARNLKVHNVRVKLLPVNRFIDEVFYPLVYDTRALLVGFNLPFDLSRLAIRWGVCRRRWRGGFSFTLPEDPFKPRIRIRSLGLKRSLIEFTRLALQHQQQQHEHYRGRFLDLHTFGFALTGEHNLTLERACDLFKCQTKKMKVSEHGKITKEYLSYNLQDTLATHDLYAKMMERFSDFRSSLAPERAYSPASIGKAYLRKMGIRPFLQQNPDFPREILGHVMGGYYGGRVETKMRKKPVKVRYLDFTSLYPSLFSLMGLWEFVIANRIQWTDCTSEVHKLLNDIDLEALRDPSVWKGMTIIVQIQPNDDILPVRSHYGDKHAYNIGINHLTSSQPLWYTLPDIIASKLLTGRSPKIPKAIKFIPQEKQEHLRPIRIVGGSTVKPDKDLFLRLRRLRKMAQERRDRYPKGSDYEALNVVQNQLKIITNSSSYGIFIEVNTDDRKCEADVYGLEEPFKCTASRRETSGSFFNPIISATITAGARLLLAMAEAWLERHKAYYAFCDTDSIAVQPFYWKRLQEYFESLNPVPEEPGFFKLEDENCENGKLVDLWFYGISAKRYVLYTINSHGETVPVKWSSHGLGNLKHQDAGDWEKELWMNILAHVYGKLSREELLERYANEHAITQLAITTPNLLRRVNAINEGKPQWQQIRPYNFVLAGSPTMTSEKDRPIIPITQFRSDTEYAPYYPFIDAKTGRVYEDAPQVYWETLDKTVENYIDHPEGKFENGESTGKMRRRHIRLKSVVYIGKEANELEETEALGLDEEAYVHYATDSPDTY
jgi:hypothetical protein